MVVAEGEDISAVAVRILAAVAAECISEVAERISLRRISAVAWAAFRTLPGVLRRISAQVTPMSAVQRCMLPSVDTLHRR